MAVTFKPPQKAAQAQEEVPGPSPLIKTIKPTSEPPVAPVAASKPKPPGGHDGGVVAHPGKVALLGAGAPQFLSALGALTKQTGAMAAALEASGADLDSLSMAIKQAAATPITAKELQGGPLPSFGYVKDEGLPPNVAVHYDKSYEKPEHLFNVQLHNFSGGAAIPHHALKDTIHSPEELASACETLAVELLSPLIDQIVAHMVGHLINKIGN